ncbi:DUF6078 family protein [Prevotella sp. P6B4]|uniref:DUF6078 family protein n=1 Tax=Prevotella sp. P6B4 TaxID=1410614 RepID=UPI001E4A8A65|nr:DUF6078 family protein [Prevotella sp. P6B4]
MSRKVITFIAMKDKVDHYTICFIDQCPLHRCCLRWLVGQYADPSRNVYLAINPHNPLMGSDNCPEFRQNVRVVMKRGFTNMYHDMPGYMEKRIRDQLIEVFGRKQYFEMRKGIRQITPDQQKQIESVCRRNGWQGPINYDADEDDWLW